MTAREVLDGIKGRLTAATPGPWDWYGNTDTRTIYLATKDRGRQFVMTFRRWGMQGAQPWFNTNMMMAPASDRPRYEVAPAATSRDDRAVYRADLSGVKHPDATFIAAAPTDVARLVAAVEGVLGLHAKSCEINGSAGCEHGDECPVLVCAPCGEPWPCPTVTAVEAALKEGE